MLCQPKALVFDALEIGLNNQPLFSCNSHFFNTIQTVFTQKAKQIVCLVLLV